METNNITIEKPYIITYSNLIEFEGCKLAFRKKELFNIDGIPTYVKRTNQGWWIGRKLLTQGKAKELITNKQTDIDVSFMQWYDQEQLNHVFNLK